MKRLEEDEVVCNKCRVIIKANDAEFKVMRHRSSQRHYSGVGKYICKSCAKKKED